MIDDRCKCITDKSNVEIVAVDMFSFQILDPLVHPVLNNFK